MTDDQGDLDVFDQLVENTSEIGEQGQPALPQEPSWRPAGATELAS